MKLHDVDGLKRIGGAKKMEISQSTLERMLDSAHKKTADAIIKDKAIRMGER